MSLTYDGHVTIGVSNVSAGVTRPSANEAVIVEYSSNTLRRFDLTALTQNGSNVTTISSPVAVCLVDNGSACVFSDTQSTMSLVNLTDDFASTISGGNTCPTFDKGQLAAGNTSTKIALCGSNTAGNLSKFDGNTYTLSTISPPGLTGFKAFTVITKGNNFILGLSNGTILEIDSNGVTQKTLVIPEIQDSTASAKRVSGLSYENDQLLVMSTGGVCYLVCYSTGVVLNSFQVSDNDNASKGTCLCDASSTTVFVSHNYGGTGSPNIVAEIDFGQTPITTRDIGFLSATDPVVATGINPNNGKAWALQRSQGELWVFSIVSRSTVDKTISLEDPAATLVGGRVIIVQDGGVGDTVVVLDRVLSATSQIFKLPSGVNCLQIAEIKTGTRAKYSISRYST